MLAVVQTWVVRKVAVKLLQLLEEVPHWYMLGLLENITNLVRFLLRCIFSKHCLQVQCHTVHTRQIRLGTSFKLFLALDIGPGGCVNLQRHNLVPLVLGIFAEEIRVERKKMSSSEIALPLHSLFIEMRTLLFSLGEAKNNV